MKKLWLFIIFGATSLMGYPYSVFVQPFQHKEVIAACLVLEAGGEGEKGMQAVMNVIQNRAKGDPGRFYAEVTRPQQFSAFNRTSGLFFRDFTPILRKARQSPAWPAAKELVKRAFDHELPDITGGATYFCAAGRSLPAWAHGLVPTVTIGAHRFMR